MKRDLVKKKVKTIKVDIDKCNGCRACEIACSAYHATPKYSTINPARSRIQVVMDMLNDEYVPIRAAGFTKSECDGRNVYTINGKEYSECSFCGASCPARDLFREPDSGLPLKCDMCEDEDDGEKEPLCVRECPRGCLTYEETYAAQAEVKLDEMETVMKSLVDKYGLHKLVDSITRIVQKG